MPAPRNPLASLLAGAALLVASQVSMAQEPVRGGTLSMVVQPEPPTLVSAFNSAAPIGVVSTKILEGLLTYDFDMNPKPVLAETWKVSPDGKTITFNLRKGVKWHDGRDFTAADVQFSVMKVWKELHPRGRSTFAKVTAVEMPSPHVAILKLSE
ncbi:MAG: ABC transporter substrate-binding protein, partial [Betaproteobacteria bacterium]